MTNHLKDLYDMGTDVTEQTGAMLAYWDNNLLCRFANKAYMEWFGHSPEEMIGKMSLPELLGSLYALNKPYVEAVLLGKNQVFERDIRTPSGDIRKSIATYRPHIRNEQVCGFYVHVADVTQIFARHELDDTDANTGGVESAAAVILKDVVHTLKSNLVSDFPGIARLAAKHYTSESTLKRIFKDKFDTTIFAYYRSLQMELAAHYLDVVKLSKKEVAAMLKFSKPSNFTTCYNRYLQEKKTLTAVTQIRRESDERFRTFIEQSPFAIAMMSLDLRYLAVSERWQTEFAPGGRDMTGLLHFELFPQEVTRWHAMYVAGVSGSSSAGEMNYADASSNETRWVKYDIRPWYNTLHEIGGILVFIEDITGLKKRDEENRRILEILNKTNEIARIGAWKRNYLTNTRIWSKITREILEVPEDYDPDLEEVILFYKEGSSRETIVKVLKEAIESGRAFDIEAQLITAKGNERKVRVIGYPQFVNGKCEKLMGIFQDITQFPAQGNMG